MPHLNISYISGIQFQIFTLKSIGMISRKLLKEAEYSLTRFRCICVTGTRQSGKTTLSKLLFKDRPYLSFENPTIIAEAEADTEAFLKKYEKGAVFDEVRRMPTIFRYLQGVLDENRDRGQYKLTGSKNFLLQEQASQSLAGRAGYLSLLALSYAELRNANLFTYDVSKIILTGGYPEIWDEKLNPSKWLNSYLQTYVQRNVRLLRNISNLSTFSKFVHVCANHAGQTINRDKLAKKTGVDNKTILAWLGLLENSYIIFQLYPWSTNPNKRLIKSPKLYFYDTGLLCHLLGLKDEVQLKKNSFYGAIFENWIISDVRKNAYNSDFLNKLYFFRDSVGNEVDLIIERDGKTTVIEIKSSQKFDSNMLKGLKF